LYFALHVEYERDNVWIGDGVLGFDVKADQVRVSAREPLQLRSPDRHVNHFPDTRPRERLLFVTPAKQGKSAGRRSGASHNFPIADLHFAYSAHAQSQQHVLGPELA
jgi:hypothetical protein